MYLLIITVPILGSAIAGLLGRTVGTTGAQLLTTTCIGVSGLLSLMAFYEVALCRSPVTLSLAPWLDTEHLIVDWAFSFDDLSVAMLLPVLVVSTLVHMYSVNYMADDPHGPRFMAYLSLFTASMVVLVTGDSYAVLFVGWEMIGVASYLLIGFWLTRVQAQKAAIKAMTVNRMGDAVLSVGFFAVLIGLGSLDHATVLAVAPFVNETLLTIIGLLLFGGAMSKSAQLPLHTWLADSQ